MRHQHSMLPTLLISAVVAGGIVYGAGFLNRPAASEPESAMARVLRTNTLRCGYYTFPPFMTRDPNTGAMSGISVDMMHYIAYKTGLKVEWSEEITFGNWVPALQAGRFDAVCTPMWPDSAARRAVVFTRSILYAAIHPFVRVDETRFSADWRDLNKDYAKIVVQEGNVTADLAREWFPNATIVLQPPGADYGTLVQDVATKKADAVLWDLNGFKQYEKTNPGQIKMLELRQPLKIMPFEIPVLAGEVELRQFLDGLIEDMQDTGALDRILDDKIEDPHTYLYPVKMYQKAVLSGQGHVGP